MKIANWFMIKNFTEHERYSVSVSEMELVKESEKAYLVKFVSEFGTFQKWLPKSVCDGEIEKKEEKEIEVKVGDKFKHNSFEVITVIEIKETKKGIMYYCESESGGTYGCDIENLKSYEKVA